ncbi:MAG: AcvB/VirJ family lysyl-phosphatidylglycerol hydrolase [Dokdonella sp.]|uniref:AcvB/VirJ family lysyl-phosphatidylglycerol hydrolase n=1 Tax=Dokdonella sp. TaxID=2291710 RepID=UPI003F80BE97
MSLAQIVFALAAAASGLRAEGGGLTSPHPGAPALMGRAAIALMAGATADARASQPPTLSPQASAANPRPSTLNYGLFGPLHLSRPASAIAHTVLLFSDRDGWTARQQGLGDALAGQGAFVVGIDLPAYLARMEAIKDTCSYPAGHVEEVAHWVERHEGVANYAVPLVVGDGAGATFAYALTAQAPAGTFEGLLTLGWDDALRFPKAFCAGDAGAPTRDSAVGWQVQPVAKLSLPWTAHPFAPGARLDTGALPLASAWRWLRAIAPAAFAASDPSREIGAAWRHWRRREDAQRVALPDDVADLPLTDIAPTAAAKDPANAHRIAIIVTGDGGWAGLDRGVADALTADGVRVIGFSTLKFFWHKQTPDAAASAIARVIAHYGAGDPDARFIVVGYSFGASLVPVIVNRLPDAARARVQGGVMISPDDEAVFEIHVGDWFGSTHHDDALPIAPELAQARVPFVCVHGDDEDDSPCRKPLPPGVRAVGLPGGHHYDGDYAALGAAIVANLPGATTR